MTKRLTTSFFFFFLLLLPCAAQDYILAKKWTSTEGLPNAVISHIAADDNGFMWIATRKGLYFFDGSEFNLINEKTDSTSNMEEAFFTRVYKDSDGLIWAGTLTSGVYVINPQTGNIRHFMPYPQDIAEGIDVRISAIYEDEEKRIWVGIKKEGFALFDKEREQFTFFKPSNFLPEVKNKIFLNEILSFHYSAPFLWLGTVEGLIRYHVKKESFTYIIPCRPENTENPGLLSQWEHGIRYIVEDKEGLLWLSFWGGGIARFNPTTGRCRNYKFDKVNKDANTAAIAYKNENELWGIANRKNAFFTFDKKSGDFHFFEPPHNCNFNLSKKAVPHIFLDKKNNLWFWTTNALLVYQTQHQLFNIKGFPFVIKDVGIHPQTGQYWYSQFLAPNFITAVDTATNYVIQQYTPLRKKSINFINQFLFTADGRIFAHENTDIFIWNKKQKEFTLFLKMNYPEGREVAGKGLISSFIDSHNNIWAGTKVDGIFKINTKTAQYKLFKNIPEKGEFPIAHNGFINCFFEDSKGRIWYGTERGFGYYDYTKEAFTNYPFPYAYTTNNPNYAMQQISAFTEDQLGRIWVSSIRKGLGLIEEKEDGKLFIKVFSTADGLKSAEIHGMLTDLNGDIWLSTASGLSRFKPATETFENYGQEYGIGEGVLRLLKNGAILIGGRQRIIQFHPDSIVAPVEKPVVHLQQFTIFDKIFKGNKHINLLDKVALSYQQNFFSLEFGALNFFNPELVEFAYKLDGINKDWIFTKDRKYASYTSLPAGKHLFRVKARIQNKIWGDEKQLNIIIKPPFWQTGWFYLLIIGSISLLIYSFYTYRIRQIRKQEAIKSDFSKRLAKVEMTALQAQMNPHFLFNSLNSIKLFIVEERNKEASHYLSQFAKLIRSVLQNSGLQFVSLADDLDTLRLYIEMEKVRFENFEYSINIQEGIDLKNIQFPPLLLQPYVENAIWHGLVHDDKTNRLKIDIKKENKILICTIEDNGIGRAATLKKNKSRLRKSMGMKITKERIELTNALYETQIDVVVEDLIAKDGVAMGTKVALKVRV